MSDPTPTIVQAAARRGVSPRAEAVAGWLIAASMFAGGAILARLVLEYPQLLPNGYIGFLIYRCAPTIVLVWSYAAAAATLKPAIKRPVFLSALAGSIGAILALSPI